MILTPEIKTILVAATPIFELRGAIPLALGVYKLSFWSAYGLAVMGNVIPVFFILWLLETVSNFLSRHFYFFNRFFAWLFERTRDHHKHSFERWETLALVILVAIPLPLTGAWTGALAAFVFGIPAKKAFLLITAGVMIAGAIVTLATLGIINLFI
ncbi:MAG: small multi-drug export protein [Candidatus Nealsonbacteria bacterium]|nr:small multi-drug export protein [Candidatus Nealsonbacteria bacterium]